MPKTWIYCMYADRETVCLGGFMLSRMRETYRLGIMQIQGATWACGLVWTRQHHFTTSSHTHTCVYPFLGASFTQCVHHLPLRLSNILSHLCYHRTTEMILYSSVCEVMKKQKLSDSDQAIPKYCSIKLKK